MAQAKRDENYVTTLLAVSNADGVTPVVLWADPVTHRLLVDSTNDAPIDATYVTLSTNADLTNERVLTGTTNQINIADNGAGSTVVLSTPQDIHTGATPTFLGLNLTSTDAGATGPVQTFLHNSATPAANDVIGKIDFKGKNSGGTTITYGGVRSIIESTTAGTEYGQTQLGIYDGAYDEFHHLLTLTGTQGTSGAVLIGDANDNGWLKSFAFGLVIKGADDGYGLEVQGSNGTTVNSTGGDIEFYPGAATNGNARGGDFLVNGSGAPAPGGGDGIGSGRGGNITMVAGDGADAAGTGAGGIVSITAGRGGATSGAAGTMVLTAGAGRSTTDGGASSLVGGASGSGATGNGGAVNLTGGAAASTNGNGGSVVLTGGAKTGTGIAGGVRVMSILCRTQAAATAKTTSATLTAAELLVGIITINQGAGATSAQQLPTGTDIAAALPSDFTTGDSFDISFINISTVDAEDATVTTNTDLTLVGSMDFPAHSAITVPSSGILRFRKTGATTFTVYRIA